MNKKKTIAVLVLLGAVPSLLAAWFVSPLYQKTTLFLASRRIESFVQDGQPKSPLVGGIVRCENGEWIIVSLHHGSRGFTMIRTSTGQRYAEVEYNPHPVMECWGTIIRGGYESEEDFFAQNKTINWLKMN